MTGAPPFTYPGSRTVAGWWRQLHPFHPRGLWMAHLLFHRVEALVRCTRRTRPDGITLLALAAMAHEPQPTLARLADRLPLDRPALRLFLRQVQETGLTQLDADGCWRLTERGREAHELGDHAAPLVERRSFYFLERSHVDRPPIFLHVNDAPGSPWPSGDDASFDLGRLHECLSRSTEWKQQHGFPLDVEEILLPLTVDSTASRGDSVPPSPSRWQRVVLVQLERLLAVLIAAPARQGGEQLLGFAVHQKGWSMNSAPAFHLGSDWATLLPEINQDPSLEVWRQVWRSWGQEAGLSGTELDATAVERRGHRLRVSTPRPLLDRLRASRSEAFKGEAWLLAGEGRFRAAAQLDLAETGR
jgi:hypothetical protein